MFARFKKHQNSLAALLAALMLATVVAAPHASAQSSYPSQPIRLVVPYPTGGNTDLVGRALALGLGKYIGQSVYVDNRGGAGGRIGEAFAAQAKPDGQTLLMSNRTAHIFPRAIPPELTFNPEAMITVSMFAKVPIMFGLSGTLGTLGVKDLKSAVSLFKANPGKYAYGSAGVGSLTHIGPDIFAKLAGVDMIHVPYKGTGPVVIDMIAGRIALGLIAPSSTGAQLRKGEIVPVAVLEARRTPEFPDVPTIAEAGYPQMLKYGWATWNALFVPAGTPAPIVETINRAMEKTVQDAETAKRFRDLGNEPEHMPVKEAAQFMEQQFTLWVPIIKALGLTE